MIELIWAPPRQDCIIATFHENGAQLMFRWLFCGRTANDWLISDWHSTSDAKHLDKLLLNELLKALDLWRATIPCPEYLLSKDKDPAGKSERWLQAHYASKLKRAAESAMRDHLLAVHPAGTFCSLYWVPAYRYNLVLFPADPILPTDSNCFYGFCRGKVWSSPEWLAPSDWIKAAEKVLPVAETTNQGLQRAISVDVRREVWRRDQGRCVDCGSQERLEFDHIIPVAMGGGSSARNVQLLCETCNRQKAATLG